MIEKSEYLFNDLHITTLALTMNANEFVATGGNRTEARGLNLTALIPNTGPIFLMRKHLIKYNRYKSKH